ncbi:MAG: NifB/NifX family molybdenum-iron cluster-binding protein [bacterium]
MIVAVSNWKDDIAVTFDFSNSLVIYQFIENKWNKIEEVKINSRDSETAVEILKRNKVEILLCGAISKKMLDNLELSNIKVIPFLRGKIEDVLSIFQQGNISSSRCFLPGFRRGHGLGRRRRFRGNKNNL